MVTRRTCTSIVVAEGELGEAGFVGDFV